MEIRNLMEDKVIQAVNEICDEEERAGHQRYCTTTQCRTDVTCYVLNRLPQRYVSSGRGFAYLETDFSNNTQLQVDIVATIHEGLRRVTEIQRSYYQSQPEPEAVPLEARGVFYFPTIKGRLFHGLTFEPVRDVTIRILQEGRLMEMVDGRWPNPYQVVGNTPGTYLFWPKPIVSAGPKEKRCFEFCLEVADSRYEPFSHYFTLELESEIPRYNKDYIKEYTVPDLFILPVRDGDNDMQLNPGDPDD